MKIKGLQSLGPPKKLEKSVSQEVRDKKIAKKESSEVSSFASGDQVEISQQAKDLQKAGSDENVLTRKLLSKLPSARAHVVYEAMAKVKAGYYASDEIVDSAARKLLESGELNNLTDSL